MNRYIFFIILMLFTTLFSCIPPVNNVYINSNINEVLIPEVESANGGVIGSSSDNPYYFNTLGAKSESDIQLDSRSHYKQTANRYMQIGGLAVPDDSGFYDDPTNDRWYHSAVFLARHYTDIDESGNLLGTTDYYFTIPVDELNQFTGYIYFQQTGNYKVYGFRSYDVMLYPRSDQAGVEYIVPEGISTVVINVVVNEAVPAEFVHLLPSRNTDCGTETLRDFTIDLVSDTTNDLAAVRRIYEFLVKGEDLVALTLDDFHYTGYDAVGVTNPWNDLFIASHFLEGRSGVCNDFAELFAAMTRSLGFNVQKCSGDNAGGTVGHMWNSIEVDNGVDIVWYKVDATWGNGNKTSNYMQYAGWYTEFNLTTFTSEHDNTFMVGYKEEY